MLTNEQISHQKWCLFVHFGGILTKKQSFFSENVIFIAPFYLILLLSYRLNIFYVKIVDMNKDSFYIKVNITFTYKVIDQTDTTAYLSGSGNEARLRVA